MLGCCYEEDELDLTESCKELVEQHSPKGIVDMLKEKEKSALEMCEHFRALSEAIRSSISKLEA